LQTVSHGGSFMGYRTEFLRFPAQRFSVICLCNLSTSNPTARARKIADIFLAGEFPRAVATTDSARSEYRVELAASALAAIAGTYRNPTTGMVWTLAVRDGHLTADAFGARIPLAPLSATHFRSMRGPAPVDIVVQPSTGSSPPRLRVVVGEDGGAPEVFDRVSPPSLTRTQLSEYAGAYDSDELRATYTFTVSGDSLYVAIPNRPRQAVVPTTRDAFVAPGLSFAFQRDGSGRITGVVVWAAQDRNIRLQRRTTAARP